MSVAQDGPAKDNGDDGSPQRHRFYEDALAIVMGTLMAALGVTLYAEATLAVGGTAGISLLSSYVSGWSFGVIFFVINLPFYVLAIARMGWPFTLRTFAAVALVSLFARLTPAGSTSRRCNRSTRRSPVAASSAPDC